ncbi:MAG TPA: kelch repeat-containing protein [Puia sp.]|jgi:N-acetylneuraminic acid mutarotase|nr:kelch repeat-containing protein [Puia sp.]
MKPLLVLLLCFCLVNCKKNSGEHLGQPEIISFMQHTDTTGATVVIVGKNFSKYPSNNKVTFNTADTPAFYSANDTLLVRVPASATTGLIKVTVYSQSAISTDTFYVGTGRWRKMADFPGGARLGAIGFSIGNKGYISLGVGETQSYNDLWEYDMTSDSWTRKADFPGLPLNDAACFIIQGQAYVGCGQSNVYPYTSPAFYVYNPQTDTWTQKADINFGGAIPNLRSLSLVVGGKGYLVSNPGWNKIIEYDPALDQWTEKGDFPGGGRLYAAGFTIGDKGYLVGGGAGNAGNPQGDCWVYDTAADQWTSKAAPPPLYDDVGFAINGKGYVGNDFFFQRLFLEYDPAADRWNYKAPFPGLASGDAVSFVINDTAFVAVGKTSNSVVGEVWRFVP